VSDQEYIDSIRKDLEDTVKYFSQAKRQERELWVANEFLINLGVTFSSSELQAVENDPPDVRFREAEFEIKEILDPGRRRHAEYKAALEHAKKTLSIDQLLEPYHPRDITYSEIYNLVEAAVGKYISKYPVSVWENMDLLFYVNLEDTRAYIKHDLPEQSEITRSGFRSVSFVAGYLSGVLMARNGVPEFLSGKTPRVERRSAEPDC